MMMRFSTLSFRRAGVGLPDGTSGRLSSSLLPRGVFVWLWSGLLDPALFRTFGAGTLRGGGFGCPRAFFRGVRHG